MKLKQKEWTVEELAHLKRLREQGATVSRASVALKRAKSSVQKKARELGIKFPDRHTERRERQAREAAARTHAGLPPRAV
jgi:GcrA cell cycle regulator